MATLLNGFRVELSGSTFSAFVTGLSEMPVHETTPRLGTEG
jgi:hypothetical protein